MNAILALAKKDVKLMFRDKFALFWIFAFPLMFALFFGSIFGDDGGGARSKLRVALVDEDGSDVAKALAAELAGSDAVTLVEPGATDDGPMTLEEARARVQKGKLTAYLRIPAGYGDNPYALFAAGDEDAPKLEVGIDPGRRAEAGFLQGVLIEAAMSSMTSRFSDPEALKQDLANARAEVGRSDDLSLTQRLALTTLLGALDVFVGDFDVKLLADGGGDGGGGMPAPFEVVDVARDRSGEPRQAFDITFPQALVWGLMSVALGFAITLVRERETGTLLRLRMAPIGRAQVLAGKALACFCFCMLTMTAIEAFAAVALGVRFDSLPLMALAMVATSICFTGLMMTVSVMGRTEAAVAGASWGLMMPFAMVGGGMIPLIAMPEWLQRLSVVSPFRWGITAVEGAAWRGFTLAEMLAPCGILVAMGAGFFALGVVIFQKLGE